MTLLGFAGRVWVCRVTVPSRSTLYNLKVLSGSWKPGDSLLTLSKQLLAKQSFLSGVKCQEIMGWIPLKPPQEHHDVRKGSDLKSGAYICVKGH